LRLNQIVQFEAMSGQIGRECAQLFVKLQRDRNADNFIQLPAINAGNRAAMFILKPVRRVASTMFGLRNVVRSRRREQAGHRQALITAPCAFTIR
jgi:hypothetical protein